LQAQVVLRLAIKRRVLTVLVMFPLSGMLTVLQRSRCIRIGINAGEAAEALSAVCGSEGNEVQASGVIDGRVAETPVQTESSFTFFTYL